MLSLGYEQYFSNNSFGYRPGTGAQHAVDVACTYLDEGFEWVVDLDIEKFFDTKSGEAGQASAHKNRLYIRYILEEEAMSTKNKQIHDQKNGLTHTLFGDNYLTDLQLSSTEKTPLGHYGRIRLNYLRKHRPGLYTRLILSGKLYEHLTEIDRASRQ